MKYLAFLNNFFAILVVASLVIVSSVTTIALSPIGGGAQPDVAGIYTGEILSNFIPPSISDVAVQIPGYSTQLVRTSENSHTYSISLGPISKQTLNLTALLIQNHNSAPITLDFSTQTSLEMTQIMHVYVSDGENSYRIHDANLGDGRVVELVIPAKGEVEVALEVELLGNLAFESDFSLSIRY